MRGDCVAQMIEACGVNLVGRSAITLASADPPSAAPGTALAAEILGQRLAAKVLRGPIYDPENARLKA